MKSFIVDALRWGIVAFLFGGLIAAGDKTLDYIWPDKPIEVQYKLADTK